MIAVDNIVPRSSRSMRNRPKWRTPTSRSSMRPGVFSAPIATRVEDPAPFHPAEAYHQDFAARNPQQPYIAAVSAPKVAKLRKLYPSMLKP
jgi:peptide methionine sulfoxide reductase MsrA